MTNGMYKRRIEALEQRNAVLEKFVDMYISRYEQGNTSDYGMYNLAKIYKDIGK